MPSVPRGLRAFLSVPSAKFVLRQRLTISSDGSGQIFQNGVVTDPNGSSSGGVLGTFSNWTQLATIYDSYKVECAVMEWYPNRPNDPSSATSYHPMSVAFDADSDAAPGSVDVVLQYDNARTFDIGKPFRYAVKLPVSAGTSVAGWRDIGAPELQPQSLIWAADSLTNSVQYGNAVFSIVCRFKSTR